METEKIIYFNVERNDINNVLTIMCKSNSSIINLKEKIKKETGIPLCCQKIYLKGNELLNNKYFSDYGLIYRLAYITLYNLSELKIKINVKNRVFEYFLESCESVLKLKENISENIKIPIDKIVISHSNKIIEDKELMENFIPNLTFTVELIYNEEININLIDEGYKEIISVDRFSLTNDIFSKIIMKQFDRLKYKDRFIFHGKFIFEYNLKNDDTIEMVKITTKSIRLRIKTGRNQIKIIIVYPDDPINIILDILNLYDNEEKHYLISFNGKLYELKHNYTFKEIGIEEDSYIHLIAPSRAGCKCLI